ncbi:ribosomal protection-like ABC-F family protein [Enterococcus sp. LJL99]
MSIELKNISISFGAKELFHTTYLNIPTGSKIGIVGDNGSGKSTLFSIIQGTCLPTTGEVVITDQIASIDQLIDAQVAMSGGEQTKKRIQEALRIPKGIVLADEPTNHLDKKGLSFLEKKLVAYDGTLLVISHNRSFLNRVVNKILEIKEGQLTMYEGNYDIYEEQKNRQDLEQQRKYEQYQTEQQQIKKAMSTVSDKSKNTRKTPKRMGNSEARLHKMGNQRAKKNLDNKVKALESRLEKLEVIDKPNEKKRLVIPFSAAKRIHRKELIRAEHYNLKVKHKKLLLDASFTLKNGSKTALVGANGAGKTTLLKQLFAKNAGLDFAQGIKFGYFSQTFEDLKEGQTILSAVREGTVYDEQVVRDLLAHMQFRGEEVNKNIHVLSGGERSKVAITKLLLSDCNVLLLDEPTNHLDISSIKELEAALIAYQGTILFISHDESFINQVATEKWELNQKKIISDQDKNRTIEQEQKHQEKLLLENRKVYLMTQLSMVSGSEKDQLEAEFQEVLEELKMLAT